MNLSEAWTNSTKPILIIIELARVAKNPNNNSPAFIHRDGGLIVQLSNMKNMNLLLDEWFLKDLKLGQ